jgi:hypothetical protein
LTALGEIEVVPFLYVVEDALVTVTFCPADVVSDKLDADTLLTVPMVPPAAGPDRALDPPPPNPGRPAGADDAVVVVAALEPLLAVALTMP